VAEIVARVYREPQGFIAVVDGWGSFRGGTLSQTVQATRSALEHVLAGAFPDRPWLDPQGADLLVHFRIRLEALRADRAQSAWVDRDEKGTDPLVRPREKSE
jgi:hypothetical protein